MPKLNIVFESDYLNGYINISPVKIEPKENELDVRVGNIATLDWVVDNGELDEIVADKIIEYIPTLQVDTVISNWVSKLKVGGQIVIGFLDILEVSRLMNLGMIDIEQFNKIVHGPQIDDSSFKKFSTHTQDMINRVIKPHSLKVVSHTLIGCDSTIVFERVR